MVIDDTVSFHVKQTSQDVGQCWRTLSGLQDKNSADYPGFLPYHGEYGGYQSSVGLVPTNALGLTALATFWVVG